MIRRIPDDLQVEIDARVTSGQYADEQSVLREGIEMLRKRCALIERLQESRRQQDNGKLTQHRELGYTPLLFVRESKKLSSGLTAPYAFLGACEYVSHQGSRPMSIVWKLNHDVPARLFRIMARQNVG